MKINIYRFFRQLTGCLFFYILISFQFGYAQKFDFKGLWITRFQLTSKESIKKIISFAEKAGFNNLLVQVRGRGDAFYQSNIVSKSDVLANTGDNKNFDPLALVIEEAHKKNMKVHAWLNTLFVWSKPEMPKDKNHIVNRHPDWIMQNVEGNLSMSYLQDNNVEGFFLSPYKVEVKNYFSKIMMELIDNYNLDGVHLDYIRYPSENFGYTPEIRNEFKMRTGKDPISLNINSSLSHRDTKLLKEWRKFRAGKLTEFLNHIVREAKKVNSDIVLSCAVKPDIQISKKHYLQFWDDWLNNKTIDFVVLMNYTSSNKEFNRRMRTALDIVPGNNVIIGISTFNQTIPAVKDKLKNLNNFIIKGYCIFSYDDLKVNKKEKLYLKHVFN